jgi:hypothetical protein
MLQASLSSKGQSSVMADENALLRLPSWRTKPTGGALSAQIAVYMKEKGQERVVEVFGIGDQELAIVGRKNADVLVEHTSVSRKHAAVFFKDDQIYVMDLASKEGKRLLVVHVCVCACRCIHA